MINVSIPNWLSLYNQSKVYPSLSCYYSETEPQIWVGHRLGEHAICAFGCRITCVRHGSEIMHCTGQTLLTGVVLDVWPGEETNGPYILMNHHLIGLRIPHAQLEAVGECSKRGVKFGTYAVDACHALNVSRGSFDVRVYVSDGISLPDNSSGNSPPRFPILYSGMD